MLKKVIKRVGLLKKIFKSCSKLVSKSARNVGYGQPCPSDGPDGPPNGTDGPPNGPDGGAGDRRLRPG